MIGELIILIHPRRLNLPRVPPSYIFGCSRNSRSNICTILLRFIIPLDMVTKVMKINDFMLPLVVFLIKY